MAGYKLHAVGVALVAIYSVEPAIHIEGLGGLRHLNVVTLREDGAEVLTPFQADMGQVTVSL